MPRASSHRRLIVLGLALTSCAGPVQVSGTQLVVPTNVAEGHNDAKKQARAPSAASASGAGTAPTAGARATGATAPASATTPDEHGFLPDPEPLTTAHQFDLTVRYDKGRMSLVRAAPVELTRAVPTPRRFGRFAVELWIGRELIDRVRFDFPLLAADPLPGAAKKPIHGDSPRFSTGADTSCHVQVPASDRATTARLVDRSSGATVEIPWPPVTL